MRRNFKFGTYCLAGISAIVAVSGIIAGCSNSKTTAASSSSSGYQGLGSKWSITFSGSSFELFYDKDADGTFEAADDMLVEGTYVQQSNNFKKMTVTSASGSNAPSAGDEAIGLEVPGFAFFLKPLGGAGEPIVMVSSGSCPSSDVNMNWIIAKYQDSTTSPTNTTDGFGTAAFNVSTDTALIDPYYFDAGTNMSNSNTINLLSCSNGVVTFDDGTGGGTMYATSNGGMLVNPGSGVIFAAPQLSADPVAADLDGTYSGLLFTSGSTEPAKVTLSAGAGTGELITNIETDATAGSSAISGLAPVAGLKGMMRGQIAGETLNCIYSSVAGNSLLACNGKDGAAVGGVYPMFFFLGAKR